MGPSVHPEPTAATVKCLYAGAFRCAHPDCSRPLYKQDNETGDRTLNSRVAHIHARRPGGPRWIEMSPEDNRAEANLLLLCIEHSYEIDELPDRYPADVLREWKRAQIQEYEDAQRGWMLTDVEAGRVLEASAQAIEEHNAGAVLGVVRASERLALASRRARRGPAAEAEAWQATRLRARGAFMAWDEDGNSVYAEPSRHETERHKAALGAALENAVESLHPLADGANGELAAVRATRPALGPWCIWAARGVDGVIAASSTWPSAPELEDDDRLESALAILVEATDALTAAWRGEPAPQPPPVPVPTPEPQDPWQDHRELLDRARPYARVDHRPYDAELRAALADAAERAAVIPPVPSALAVGLSTTCHLAAAVGGNADDEVLATLADQDARRRPLSVAVHLLAESARVAETHGRAVPRARAESALVALWDSVDVSDADTWNEADANGHAMLWEVSRIASPEQVKERLSQALALRPDLVLPLVTTCAGWAEQRDWNDWRFLGCRRRYRELPAWFPTQAVMTAAGKAAPNAASAAVDAFGETEGDDPASLLAQALWLADRRAT